MSTSTKRQALIIIPSATDLPLAEPQTTPSLSTGFFLVELAAVLKEFERDYEFTLATPDGQVPQLDVNGMGLAFHAIEQMGSQTFKNVLQQRKEPFDADEFRARHPRLTARREDELQLLERHLGRLPVSEVLPNTEKEVVAFRPDLIRRLEALQPKSYASVEELVRRHRDAADEFDFGTFDFIHAPGGHAPMVSFLDDPWLGEALHLARENKVLISLICHAPVAMTSTNQRIDADGTPYRIDDNPFHAATITTVPKHGERLAERVAYIAVPGERTRLTYYVDQALKAAGFKLKNALNPSAPRVIHEPSVGLLTGNGPSAVDQQARNIREILAASRPGASASPGGQRRYNRAEGGAARVADDRRRDRRRLSSAWLATSSAAMVYPGCGDHRPRATMGLEVDHAVIRGWSPDQDGQPEGGSVGPPLHRHFLSLRTRCRMGS